MGTLAKLAGSRMNKQRQRALMAAQKVRRVSNGPIVLDKLPALSQEQRRELYAPKPAAQVPAHLQAPEWVRAWRMVERATYGVTAISGLLFGGLLLGVSKKSVKQ